MKFRFIVALALMLITPHEITRTAAIDSFQIHMQTGQSYMTAGKNAEAIEEFEKAVRLDPTSGVARFQLARARSQLQQWDKALEEISRAIALEPHRPEYYNQRGLIYSQLKQFNRALADMVKAIDLKPESYLEYFYYNLALVYRDLLRPDDAMAACQKALQIDPSFQAAHLSLGEIYLEKNRLQDAIRELSAVTSLHPKTAKPYVELGIAYARSGQHEQAAQAFKTALEREPANYQAHYNLSVSLKESGKAKEAQYHLDLFAKLQAEAERREYEELQLAIKQRTDLQRQSKSVFEEKAVVASPSSPVLPSTSTDKSISTVSKSVTFRNITSQAHLAFRHQNGATSEKYMPETMGSGCLFFDFDGDNWIDIYLVNGGSLVNPSVAGDTHGALYRNNKDGTFVDVTAKSKIQNSEYGMGACAADYDNDGLVDLYLTNFGSNILYHNNGNGTFGNTTSKAGVGAVSWGSSCGFGDIDRDGFVDLVVVNYVDFSLENNKFCGSHIEGLRSYCHPNVYHGLPNVLYHNNGDGTFTDVSHKAGIDSLFGKGLGVAFADYNNDGWPDIYVANDSVPNFLFRNDGKGGLQEVGLASGVAVSEDGKPRAGMGIDWGDIDNDGWLDIYVTNLNTEANTLYRNNGSSWFSDITWQAGLGEPTLPFVGFGAAFFDYDNDGWLDIVVANGHILDNVSLSRDNISYAQRRLLFHNAGKGKFNEVGATAGEGFTSEKVGRGLAIGDIDNDGDLDILVNNCNQSPDLLLNDNQTGNHWLIIKTLGSQSNRDGIGTRIIADAGPLHLVREVKAGSSYQSQNDLRVHFGLGRASRVDRLELRWPSGSVDVLQNLETNQLLTIRERVGIVNWGIAQQRSQSTKPVRTSTSK